MKQSKSQNVQVKSTTPLSFLHPISLTII
ncbi:hypothetical protein PHET_11636 [Paragonimus heterotremus]|uniref:Uncharacterized protein n=1 Tax=Paragonimus heterotremus TaxID=100268 RepID=A0A8J4WM56_9TREM|nr:hypothetical protein PHET_11636 [Paragonimus heterotremus]